MGLLNIKAPEKGAFSFSVQGIHKGFITLHSEACNISVSQHYEKSELINFIFNPPLDRCLISVSVNPDFSSDEINPVNWENVVGVILVKRDKYETGIYSAIQVPLKTISWLTITASEDNTKLFYLGCGEHEDIKIKKGSYTFLFSQNKKSLCILEGFFKNRIENKTIISLLSSYDPRFQPLPIPSISLDHKYLNIASQPEVSLITVNSRSFFDDFISVRIIDYPIRINFYTVNGRTSHCLILRKGDKPLCLN
jgi:hypothetical protein